MFKYGVFSGPYFPVFELNTEIYRVNLRIQPEYRLNLRIQPEYRKMATTKNSVFGHFLRSVIFFCLFEEISIFSRRHLGFDEIVYTYLLYNFIWFSYEKFFVTFLQHTSLNVNVLFFSIVFKRQKDLVCRSLNHEVFIKPKIVLPIFADAF